MTNYDRVIQLDVLAELPFLLGIDALRVFIDFLISPFGEIRALATTLLADNSLGEEHVYAVADLLDDEEPGIRSLAVEVLVADSQEELVLLHNNYR